jgi:hypothetical protein
MTKQELDNFEIVSVSLFKLEALLHYLSVANQTCAEAREAMLSICMEFVSDAATALRDMDA